MFTIHSIGDSAFLQMVLNAVAMITGTGDFVKLCSIGVLLGVVVVCVRGILSGGNKIEFQQILVGFLCWLCFFGPSVTVVIEDAYTGDTRVVDNVPIGVGFSGSLISNVGYGITELFETAYQPVAALTDRPFAESLRQLSAIRKQTYDANVIKAFNDSLGNGADIERSLKNYIRECTMVGIALGEKKKEDVYTQSYRDVSQNNQITSYGSLKFDSKVFGTRLYLGKGEAEKAPTCSEAWTMLNDVFTKSDSQPVLKALANSIGIKETEARDQINSSLTQMGVSATQIHDFINVALISQIFDKAAESFYASQGDKTMALMINQAVLQRNTQWAAEQSMFMTTIRPILTFFEGFVYAITPVMGFLMVMGSFGMMLTVRYFQTVIWIQLWFPVMSICNLYITMAAQGALNSLGGRVDSFYAIDAMATRLDTWLSTGGMLCAATPMIALFLVTGSTYAFTTLANRMQGGDHIDEKMVTPDTLKMSPYYQRQSHATGDTTSLAVKTGSESLFHNIDRTSAYSENSTSQQIDAQSAVGTLANTISKSNSSVFSQGHGAKFAQGITESLQAGKGEAYSSIKSYADNVGWSLSNDKSSMDQLVGSASAHAAAGGSITAGWLMNRMSSIGGSFVNSISQSSSGPKMSDSTEVGDVRNNLNSSLRETRGQSGTMSASSVLSKMGSLGFGIEAKAGVEGRMTSQTSDQHSISASQNIVDNKSLNWSESKNAELKEAFAAQVTAQSTKDWAKSSSGQKMEGFSEQVNEANSRIDSFSRAQSMQQTMSGSRSMNSERMARMINRTPGSDALLSNIKSRLRSDGLMGDVNARSSMLQFHTGIDAKTAETAAILETLQAHNHNSDLVDLDRQIDPNMVAMDRNRAMDNAGLQHQTIANARGLYADERLQPNERVNEAQVASTLGTVESNTNYDSTSSDVKTRFKGENGDGGLVGDLRIMHGSRKSEFNAEQVKQDKIAMSQTVDSYQGGFKFAGTMWGLAHQMSEAEVGTKGAQYGLHQIQSNYVNSLSGKTYSGFEDLKNNKEAFNDLYQYNLNLAKGGDPNRQLSEEQQKHIYDDTVLEANTLAMAARAGMVQGDRSLSIIGNYNRNRGLEIQADGSSIISKSSIDGLSRTPIMSVLNFFSKDETTAPSDVKPPESNLVSIKTQVNDQLPNNQVDGSNAKQEQDTFDKLKKGNYR